ncbi:MAG: VOC family protein [Proteobacteria bacterium]|nr:VOC family protein [Pseudomonadota bacterium]
MKIGKISQIAISVSSLEASIAFYGKTLGLPLLFKADPGMAFFDIEGLRLMLSEAEEVSPIGPSGPILYFSTPDIAAAWKDLGEKGAEMIREPQMTHKTDDTELWLAFFKDPDGHTLALMEERAI